MEKKDERISRLKNRAEKLRSDVGALLSEYEDKLDKMTLDELCRVEGQRFEGKANRLFMTQIHLDEVLNNLSDVMKFDDNLSKDES